MNKPLIITLSAFLLSIALGVYLSPLMPDSMVSHWGITGEPNGYMPKAVALSLVPFIMLIMAGLFELFSHIDPLKENIASFRKEFDMFMIALVLFLFYIHILTLLWNMGITFNLGQWMLPAMGLLFWNIGTLLGKTKRNYFVGIRTPWTLANDTVWEKTHILGGKLFKVSGIVTALGTFAPMYGFILLLVTIVMSAFISIIYSYIVFKKESAITEK